jgi:hypothetical protein
MRVIGIFLFLFCACKPASKNQAQSDNVLQKVVNKEVGESASVSKNTANTFALAFTNRNQSVQYVVIRLSDNKVVFKNKIRGSIQWSGDMQLTEVTTPGMVKKEDKPEDRSKLIDLNKYLSHKN